MDKLKMHSLNFTEQNIARLAELFPNCVTESANDDGNLRTFIDFDQLRQELSGNIVDGPRERYHLNWPGKKEALLVANAPIAKTLRPCRQESVNFDTTKNLFIEGDNLEVLKLLQETYLNKVKMIYIDPPYNTGKDFVYSDDFSEDSHTYFSRSNQKDSLGNRMVVNVETNGRFHSDWLSMLYSRLRLARNLLRDDGVIFVSIDFREAANLRQILNEVFGEENMVFDVAVVNNLKGRNDREGIATCHEQLLIYRKSDLYESRGVTLTAEQQSEYSETDDKGLKFQWRDLRKRGGADTRKERPNMFFPVYIDPDSGAVSPIPDKQHTVEVFPTKSDGADGCWRWGKEKVMNGIHLMRGTKVRNKDRWNVSYRVYLGEGDEERRGTPKSIWMGPTYSSDSGTKALAALFPSLDAKKFTPKPVGLLQTIIDQAAGEGDLVMDFFAGTGTFVEALLKQVAVDGLMRPFIIVQLAESIDVEMPDDLQDIRTISALARERIRRCAAKLRENSPVVAAGLDSGFRTVKVDTSNMKDVYYAPDGVKQGDLLDQIENIKEDRTPEDLLFQVLLDWGVDLSLPIAEETIEGKNVYFVDENGLAACFDKDINEELVKTIAARKPLRAVFRDSGYGTDSVKINVGQIFKLISPSTEVKSI